MKKRVIKFLSLLLCFVFPLFSFGCKEEFDLSNYVTELREDVFEGQTDNFHLKAGYGFREDNQNALTLKLIGKYDQNVSYSAKITHNGVTIKQAFSYNPVTSGLSTCFDIPEFNQKEFDVTIISASDSTVVTLKSTLPENTLDYKTALKHLQVNQPDLINSYFDDNGNFTASVIVRVIVKNDCPYWYVGLKNQNSNLKALLVDGKNGEILAIREVF